MNPSPFFNDISTIADGGDLKTQRTCLIDHQNTVSVYTDAMNVERESIDDLYQTNYR